MCHPILCDQASCEENIGNIGGNVKGQWVDNCDSPDLEEDCNCSDKDLGNNWNVSSVIDMESMFLPITSDCSSCESRPKIVDIVGNFDLLVSECLDNSNCPEGAPVRCWNTAGVTDMSEAFFGQENFNEPLLCWDVSSVTKMNNMFRDTSAFNKDLKYWNVSSVTTMSSMFINSVFNQDLSDWDVSSVTTMSSMFIDAAFNQDLNRWNVSSVNNMNNLFRDASAFNQDLNDWDVSSVTTMSSMFIDAVAFNQDLIDWNVSSVTDMASMFCGTSAFNQDLNDWDVSYVRDMYSMFDGASAFNQNLNNWNTTCVTDMQYMFSGVSTFDQYLNDWDVSSVTRMNHMFSDASAFNQDLNRWNVPNVRSMDSMFRGASTFNQNLDEWDVSMVTRMDYMFRDASSFNQCMLSWGNKFVYNSNCPSDSPSELCLDNGSFVLTSDPSLNYQDCSWVRNESPAACEIDDVYSNCRASCNPECFCEDVLGDQVYDGFGYQNCGWVAQISPDLCFQNSTVFTLCRATCDPVCYCTNSDDLYDEEIVELISPPFNPTVDPKFRNCNWVRDNFSEDICAGLPGVYFGCRDVCDQTCYCKDDPTYMIDQDTSKASPPYQNCAWVRNPVRGTTEELCADSTTYHSCRDTCDPVCSGRTFAPSPVPTSKLTKKPTFKPTANPTKKPTSKPTVNPTAAPTVPIEISILVMETGKTISMTFNKSDTILQIKKAIEIKEGISAGKQTLWQLKIKKGVPKQKIFADERTIDSYNSIKDGTTLIVSPSP